MAGLLVFTCMFIAVTLLRRPGYPLHLIPLASAMLYLLAPPLGALAAAVLISISDGSPSGVTIGHMVRRLGRLGGHGLGAWVVHRVRRTAAFASR
jgi:hypothetical protein